MRFNHFNRRRIIPHFPGTGIQAVSNAADFVIDNNFEFTPNSEWISVANVEKNEIWILATDEGDRYSSFVCTVANSGPYNMEIYGGSDGLTLLSTYGSTASGTQMSFQMPTGTGKYCSEGYYTYKIRIYATTEILSFSVAKHASTTTTYNRWKIINFGTENINSILCYTWSGNSLCPELVYANTYHCELINMDYCFANCTALVAITMAKRMNSIQYLGTNNTYGHAYGSFYNCTSLKELVLPEEMNSLINFGPHLTFSNGIGYGFCQNCTSLLSVTFPRALPSCIAFGSYYPTTTYTYGAFYSCTSLHELILPSEMPSLLTLGAHNGGSLGYAYGLAYGCTSLTQITIPDSMPSLISYGGWDNRNSYHNGMVLGCSNLIEIKGGLYMPSLLTCVSAISGCTALTSIPTCSTFSSNSVPFYSVVRALTSFVQPTMRSSNFVLTGTSSSVRSNVTSIIIDWANSVFSGTNPQIDIRYNALSAATINAIFTALPDYSGSGVTHTINVASNVGSATCTPAIATVKGWTVVTS